MKEEVKVPPMGESISEATISAILKPAGSSVQMDEELFELATDKVNQVLYAPQAGIFTPSVKEDDVVKIGQVLGHIEVGAQATKESTPSEPKEPKNEFIKEISEASKISAIPPQAKATTPPTQVSDKSSETQARITTDEYLKEVTAQTSTSASPSKELKASSMASTNQISTQAKSATRPKETRKKITKIRKIIATRLVEVQNTTAMLTTFNEADLTELMAMREKYKESFQKAHDVRLGLMSFFVKAAVSALKAFPAVNSYIDGDEMVERNTYDIGIAVGGEKGLVVPIVRDCDQLSFAQIERAISTYAQKVKDGTLSADDLMGGGFTITNGGVYGSLLSTPIINPKQCAILGMHKISKRPMVMDDQIVIRQMMYLALSYDHRIIDGKEAVSFLIHIKNCLEDPRRLLLEV